MKAVWLTEICARSLAPEQRKQGTLGLISAIGPEAAICEWRACPPASRAPVRRFKRVNLCSVYAMIPPASETRRPRLRKPIENGGSHPQSHFSLAAARVHGRVPGTMCRSSGWNCTGPCSADIGSVLNHRVFAAPGREYAGLPCRQQISSRTFVPRP